LSDMIHRLSVRGVLGALHLDASIDFSASWTVIFGPSGSGKSSLLRAMCGLLPEANTSFCAGSFNLDHVATRRRNLAYAPQTKAIFPHLSVRQNVAFPLITRHLPTHGVEAALEMFKLGLLASRMPSDLSGGELQRVNLARAYAVPNPTLMLLDEPFTGIDRSTREVLLSRMVARAVPTISVTHDVEEALMLNAEVVRMEQGKIIAQGLAPEVLAAERAQMLKTLSTPGSSIIGIQYDNHA
jgi:molybdate transport system ATP-binding protein